jgi:hypothetical protein
MSYFTLWAIAVFRLVQSRSNGNSVCEIVVYYSYDVLVG